MAACKAAGSVRSSVKVEVGSQASQLQYMQVTLAAPQRTTSPLQYEAASSSVTVNRIGRDQMAEVVKKYAGVLPFPKR